MTLVVVVPERLHREHSLAIERDEGPPHRAGVVVIAVLLRQLDPPVPLLAQDLAGALERQPLGGRVGREVVVLHHRHQRRREGDPGRATQRGLVLGELVRRELDGRLLRYLPRGGGRVLALAEAVEESHAGTLAPGSLRQAMSTLTEWIARPARAPTTVPLIRMNCRSRPTKSSIRSLASSASQRSTVTEMTSASSSP